MIDTYEVLLKAQELGIEVTAAGERLRLKAPVGVVTPEMRRLLKAHKTDILLILALREKAGCKHDG